ncbi:MAG TPA: histidine phosphatase family protein [Ktedonobacterales bacterium]
MNLYFMRHAHAVEQDEWTGSDAARPLIEKGRKAADEAARGVARLAPPVMAIVSSPYLRALQTAEIVGKRLSLPIAQCEALSPMFDITRLPEALDAAGWAQDVLLIGHQPSLSEVLAHLTGHTLSKTNLKKAAVAMVTLPEEAARERRLVKAATLEWIRRWSEWQMVEAR